MLDVASQQRITVVVAPPGYGKTTLLAQWAAQNRQPRVRWLTINPRHNHSAHFAADLRRALDPPHRMRLARHRSSAAGVSSLFEGLEDIPPTTLVLDDFHLLSNQTLLDDCATLIERAPRSIHVVLAGRVDPPLRYYRFRLSEGLFELRQEQLAFTPEEGAKLIQQLAERPVTTARTDAVVDRTEGWATGLQFAGLALRQPAHVADVADVGESFCDDDGDT